MTDPRPPIDDELEDRTTELYDRDHLLGIELPDQPAARATQAAHDAALHTARATDHYRLVDLIANALSANATTADIDAARHAITNALPTARGTDHE